ncbi:MAG: UDP-N-acetylglucosamine 2-epimerase (non-hydrolyzing) [Ignavibacteriales bacterium]|nr:UDP-N-acetylglucosamine 2-epimerase (non-hydrolyzing) [Ignavibacteriales bacterium]
MKTILCIFGTRPDTIKMAPVIHELRRFKREFRVITVATAQHRHMLDQVLEVFRIKPTYDLNIMQTGQTLSQISSRTLERLDTIVAGAKPDLVLVQGDTSTTFLGSLVAFYHKVSVGHIEAGLRTLDKLNPFPEEINRRLTGHIADLHFAATKTAKKLLLAEGVDRQTIFTTGNTVIDALVTTVERNHRFDSQVLNGITREAARGKRLVLITIHRRENWGKPMLGACKAIKRLANENSDVNFVFPVHRNPVVRNVVYPTLSGLANILLLEPLNYKDFVNLMKTSSFIVTDSGGIQEEAPSLGKPVLVLRKVTERPEAVRAGTVKLVGLDEKRIYRESKRLLSEGRTSRSMAKRANPYGDGKAAWRTVQAIRWFFGYRRSRPAEFKP